MREIKFRAWDKENKQMITYFDISSKGTVKKPTGIGLINTNKILDVILMQYTGLKDKNGNEIYEGDIIDLRIDDQAGNKHSIGYVEFDNKLLRYLISFIDGCAWASFNNVKIIGNIYENPELVKE